MYFVQNKVLKKLSKVIQYNWERGFAKEKLTREGCNALVGFKRTEDGKYLLYKFYN